MADDKLAAERARDKRTLIAIIQDIGDQLRIIVFDRKKLFRSEYRRYFPGPWEDVQGRLNRASHELEAMQPDDLPWEYIEGAGLVRDSLPRRSSGRLVQNGIQRRQHLDRLYLISSFENRRNTFPGHANAREWLPSLLL